MPCLAVKLVPRASVVANNYNPNAVSPDKMRLLAQSIQDNGFCFPIVTVWDPDASVYVIVDGFHRRVICDPDWLDIDPVPIVVLRHDITQRMAATVQFNKARGVHQVDLDAEVVRALIGQGLAEEEVAARLGLDLEAVHRYKQLTGVADLFRNADYSGSWEMVDDADPK
jgi:ParB-like chromosome segregation protein Spo0J